MELHRSTPLTASRVWKCRPAMDQQEKPAHQRWHTCSSMQRFDAGFSANWEILRVFVSAGEASKGCSNTHQLSFSGTSHAISDALEQYELREGFDTVPGLPNVASRGLKRSDSNRIGNRRVSGTLFLQSFACFSRILCNARSLSLSLRLLFCVVSNQHNLHIKKTSFDFSDVTAPPDQITHRTQPADVCSLFAPQQNQEVAKCTGFTSKSQKVQISISK